MRDWQIYTMDDRQICLNTMNFIENWEDWQTDLRVMVDSARESGESSEKIREMVIDTLDFLSRRVCPGSPEDKMISAMWNKASPEERRTVANLVLKMVGY